MSEKQLCMLCFKDINECLEETHMCAHMCHNIAGSYFCSCNSTGYRLLSDGLSCNGESLITSKSRTFIIF